MILKSLATVNFRRLGTFSTAFTDGLNVVVGENARGKSTLFQAIGFALYGNDAVPVKEADIRTWGEAAAYSVQLHFSHEGSDFAIKRSKSTASAHRDGELVANGKTEVTKFISELLDLVWKDFKIFVLSSQFSTAYAIEEGATALNRKVEERSGLQLIDRVESLARQRYNDHTRRAEISTPTAEDMKEAQDWKEQTAAKHADRHDEYDAAVANLLPAFSEKPPAQPNVTDVEELVDAQHKVAAAQTSLQNKQHSLEVAIASVAEAIEATPQAAPEEVDESQAKEQRARMAELKSLQSQHLSHTSKLEAAEERLTMAESLILAFFAEHGDEDKLNALLAPKAETRAQLREDAEKAAGVVAKAKADLSSLQELAEGAVCPTCKRAFEDHDPAQLEHDLDQAVVTLDQAKEHQTSVRARLATVEAEYSDVQSHLHTLEDMQASHTKIEAEVEELKSADVPADVSAEIESLVNALNASEVAVRTYQEKLEAYKRAFAVLEKRKAHQAECEEQVEYAQNHLAKLPVVTDEEIEAARSAMQDYREQVSSYRSLRREHEVKAQAAMDAHRAAERALTEAIENAERAENRVNDLQGRLVEAEKLRKDGDKYRRLAKFLSEKRADYLAQVWGTILAVASAQVKSATGGEIESIDFHEGTFYYEEGGNKPPVAAASGAQRAFIGSAIRVGLGRALYGDSSLLMFDEPTESMSERNAAGVVGSLATAAKQVLLITHKESDQELSSNVISLS